MQKKIGEDRTCNAGDMIADRHTHRQTHRHAQHNTPLPYRGRSNDSRRTTYLKICRTDLCQIFRMCRTLAADDQSKLLFRSFKGCCHDNLLLMALSIGLIFCHASVYSGAAGSLATEKKLGGVRRLNEVNARRARLVLGWVTVFGRVYHLGM